MPTLSKTKIAALESWVRKVMRTSYCNEPNTDNAHVTGSRFIHNGLHDDYRLLELVEIVNGKQIVRKKAMRKFTESPSGGREGGE